MITVISAYRVSQTAVSQGADTAYNQQYHALHRQGHLNPKPTIQFIDDLINIVNNL